jgi:hypothetical protein
MSPAPITATLIPSVTHPPVPLKEAFLREFLCGKRCRRVSNLRLLCSRSFNPECYACSVAFRSFVSGLFLISHGKSKIIVEHFSAVKAGHKGSPAWFGLPVRAK